MNISPISFQMIRSNYQIKINENHTTPSFKGPVSGKNMGNLGKAVLGIAGTGIAASLGLKHIGTEKTEQYFNNIDEIICLNHK